MSLPTFRLPPSMHCSQSRAGQQWVWGLPGKWTRKLVLHGLRDSCTGEGLHLRAPTSDHPPPSSSYLRRQRSFQDRRVAAPSPCLPQQSTCDCSPFRLFTGILVLYTFSLGTLSAIFPHLTRMTSPSMPEGEKGWTTAHMCLGPQLKTTCNWHISPSALNEYSEYLHSTVSSNSEVRLLGFKFWLWPHLEIKMETIAVLASQSCYEDYINLDKISKSHRYITTFNVKFCYYNVTAGVSK